MPSQTSCLKARSVRKRMGWDSEWILTSKEDINIGGSLRDEFMSSYFVKVHNDSSTFKERVPIDDENFVLLTSVT
ncbi:hypothetical protein N7488_004776 [Penicillium malachiteum]|nr:hypothetical protein N7488_004776 [Penicillium malachiteum]